MIVYTSPKLNALYKKIIEDSTLPLYAFRKENNYFPVLGIGDEHASILFIGEAPGKNEAKTGRPFIGAAGRILDELLETIELKRDDVFISNLVNDRPPENRDPTKQELKDYSPFLDELISIIKPKILVTLGRFSMTYLLDKFDAKEKNKTISELHGKIIEINKSNTSLKLLPLYHPAVSLYNSNTKNMLKEDFKILKNLV
jgi:DNA polymerase